MLQTKSYQKEGIATKKRGIAPKRGHCY